jgi:lambda family phage portal protein
MAKRGRPKKISVRLSTPPKKKKSVKAKSKSEKPKKKIQNPPVGRPARRKYEGASKSKRLSRWYTSSSSANTEIQGGLVTLRDRARDLRRNNPWAAKGISVITSNVVGPGISTQFRAESETGAKAFEALWKDWAETTAIDFDGRNNIYGLQRLIMDAVIESGEVLVRKRYSAINKFPLQYQVLEADFLDVGRNESLDNGNFVLQGIEFDSQGRRKAYYLFEQHPGGYEGTTYGAGLKSNRVPENEVRHVFRMERPGQARGIPWLAPVIVRLKDLDDMEDATLVRAKVAACFTAFVRDISVDFGEREDAEEVAELGDRLEPAIIEHLPPGKQVEFANPPNPVGYGEFVIAHLRGIAAGLQITYEALTGDLSQVNFSSARMGWLEMGRSVNAWREHVLIAHCLNPIADDFLQTAKILGRDIDGIGYVHVPPKREMFDPTKEIPAIIKALRAGLTTLSDELMANGKDPTAFLQQYKKDMDLLDELELKLISDPRNEMKGGPGDAKDSGNEGDE